LANPFSSISIGGSALIWYRNVSLSFILPDVPPIPPNVCTIQTVGPPDPTAQTNIVTGNQGDIVRINATQALGTALFSIDDSAGLATAQFTVGAVNSNQVTFLAATDLSVTGGSFEVASSVAAADAYVSAGSLTVDQDQSLTLTGNLGLSGGVTHVAGGAVSDDGDFTQAGSNVLSIDLANDAPTPIAASGTITLSGILKLNTVSGFSPGPLITLIENDGDSPVVGHFEGMPEGSIITVNNFKYVISYKGGSDGQDVVLKVTSTMVITMSWSPSGDPAAADFDSGVSFLGTRSS
jgi:phage baseplate assembly protein gpV